MPSLEANLAELSRLDTPPAISMFAPEPEPGTDKDQARIVFENERAELEAELSDWDAGDRDALLRPLARVAEEIESYGRGTVVAFRSPDIFELIHTRRPLPARVVVGPRFMLRPLVAEAHRDLEVLVLALSLDHVRLYRAHRDGLERLLLSPDVPTSLTEARGHEVERPSLQHHSTARAGPAARFHGTGRIGRAGTFHTQGRGRDDRKDEIRAFFIRLRAALDDEALPDLPILLAGVEFEIAHFRQVAAWPSLLEEAIELSPDGCTEAELHEAAVEAIDHLVEKRQREAWQAIIEPRDVDRVVNEPSEIVQAAVRGEIDTLFVGNEAVRGHYDAGALSVRVDPSGPEDLVNLAVCLTLRRGGRVLPVPDADGRILAAQKRFA